MRHKIPILILAYNRPDLVEQVMRVVQIYQPARIYLSCDGSRPYVQGDAEAVARTQQVLCQMVNWDCDVKYLFRDSNLGCAQGVYEAITWFFDNEEYGVILEDDVLVSQDFFKFCEDLLPRYKDETRIMQIISRNTSRRTDIPNTYVYTQTDSCWGWATWRRAWKCMDMTMSGVKNLSVPYLIKRWGLFKGCMWYYYFNYMYNHLNQSNSWATRWALSITCNDGLVICPGVNMGINIGMSSGEHYAANRNTLNPAFRFELQSMSWPLKYNDTKLVDKKQKRYDSKFFFEERMYGLIHKKWL